LPSSLHQLTLVNEAERDDAWEAALLGALAHGELQLLQNTPQVGPDKWPYIYVQTSEGAQEPALKIIEWLSEKGIGLVVNPQKNPVDYVLNYGMIWNFRQRGEFVTRRDQPAPKFELNHGTQILAGPPSEDYLPTYVRNVLRTFLMEQGVMQPRILVMSEDQISFDLCFSLDSLGNPSENEHEGIATALSWFLPTHYSIVLVNETGLPAFSPL